MNKTQVKGKMRQFRGELKKEWGKLTDDDFRRMDGEIDKLVGIFQERYGHTRGAASKELQRYLSRYEDGRETLSEQFDKLTGKDKKKSGGAMWLWVALAAATAVVAARFWADWSNQDR